VKNELKIAFHTQYLQSSLNKGEPVTAVWETNGSSFAHQYETQILGTHTSQATKFVPWRLTCVGTQFVTFSVPPFGASNFEMASGFLENVCTPDSNTAYWRSS
jgi:hypothetical protein